ncbi:SDR family oxidoreductase [Caballeronia sp. 15715]|jgi:NAD(P)-dependent dehydrogenase (short-subunit alcohol dehydrogenase family)|uniref:SDR family oxidoreductase n=1 Tax=unclassified Caballeronia TaxID=2646786 RepID=UPI0039E3227A
MNRATGHRFVGRDETAKARLVGSIPAKRAATMGEISETIVFIASAKAPYLTGRSIAVDGDYTAR